MTAPTTTDQVDPALKLFTPDEVCAMWGVKKSWLYDEVESGRLKAIRLRKFLRFRPSDLEEYLNVVAA